MPKHDRNESYRRVRNDAGTVKSPVEAKPHKFALVQFHADDEQQAWVTTHRTVNEVCQQIEEGENEDYEPSYVVDLDTGKVWEPEFNVRLVDVDDDYFAADPGDAIDTSGEEVH